MTEKSQTAGIKSGSKNDQTREELLKKGVRFTGKTDPRWKGLRH